MLVIGLIFFFRHLPICPIYTVISLFYGHFSNSGSNSLKFSHIIGMVEKEPKWNIMII